MIAGLYIIALFVLVMLFVYTIRYAYWLGKRRANRPRRARMWIYEDDKLKQQEIQLVFVDDEVDTGILGRIFGTDADFWHGLSTELLGAILTTLIFTFAVGAGGWYTDRQQEKRQLINEMASGDNSSALRAVILLRDQGWLTDGALREVNLFGANLQNADLSEANLQGVDLRYADLSGASLRDVNLQGADLRNAILDSINTRSSVDPDLITAVGIEELFAGGTQPDDIALLGLLNTWRYAPNTDLRGADLRNASIVGADLSFSRLNNVNLLDADLSGANLYMADMQNAIVDTQIPDDATVDDVVQRNAAPPIFNRDTLLPNGRLWRDTVDMRQFSDVNNTDYIAQIPTCRVFSIEYPDTEIQLEPSDCPLPRKILPYPPRD